MTIEEKLMGVEKEKVLILAIARELAAKCVRGQKACSACGAVTYMGTFAHNDGCPVQRLDVFP